MNNKKSILLIIPNLGHGGAQKSISELSLFLEEHFKVALVCFDNTKMVYPATKNLKRIDLGGRKGVMGKFIAFRKRVKALRRIKKEEDIDISISFLEGANYVNILSSKKDKTIISIRGSKIHDQNIKGMLGKVRLKWFIPRFYKRADQIVTISTGISTELVEHLGLKKDNINIIPNYFNTSAILQDSKEVLDTRYSAIFNAKTIISHGRLSVEKGHQYLIDVMSKLVVKNPTTNLVLLGEGGQKKTLIEQCSSLGLSYQDWEVDDKKREARVHFIPFQLNVFPFLKKADCFVLSSLHEGFGRSLVEAMLCELPVVASDCPYSPEEILGRDNSVGDLLPPIQNSANHEAYVKTISEVITRVNDQKIENALKKARSYDIKLVQGMWLDLINSQH